MGERLHRSLCRWLVDLFCRSGSLNGAALVESQKRIGELHARIPIHLVMQGAEALKGSLLERLHGRNRTVVAVQMPLQQAS